jgi:hypothetical protein
VPAVRYAFTARDLATIARNIGLGAAPQPDGVLDDIARAAVHPEVQASAGLLFTAVLAARPFAADSIAFAIEATRTFLIANGVRVSRIADPGRVLALAESVRSRALEDADEIGKRLIAL